MSTLKKRDNISSHQLGRENCAVLTYRLACKCVLALAVILLLHTTMAMGQVNAATLTGTVKDASGAIVQGATVNVLQVTTGAVRETATNEAGLFNVPFLQPGEYKVSTSKSGYQRSSQKVALQVNQIANLTFTLSVGTVSESVQVSTADVALQTETSSLGTVIGNQDISDLPLNGRQFIQLLQLAPGTVPISVSQSGLSDIGSSSSNVTPSINGGSNRSNLFYVDGLYATDPFFSSLSISPSIDAIQEFQEQTHADQAQFGGSTGGTVNLVTKGGGNNFHGSAYEFFRNNNIAARSKFQTGANAGYLQNQYGGSLGGPVLHNKIFFFGFYDGYRERDASSKKATIPTSEQLAGDFSASSTKIYDPTTYNATTHTIQQFQSTTGTLNVIPTSRLNTGLLAVLKAYVPTTANYTDTQGTGYNYINTADSTDNQQQYSIRMDYNIRPTDLVYGRFSHSKNATVSPSAMPTNAWISGYAGTNAGGTWVHTFSPSLVSQITAGYNSAVHPQAEGMPDAATVFSDAGFSQGFTSTPGGIKVPMIPSIGTTDTWFGLSGGWGPIGPMHLIQASGSVTDQAGNHALTFGAAYYHVWMYTNWAGDDMGFNKEATWNPETGAGGNTLASLLIGLPNYADRQLGNSGVNLNSDVMGAFAQDTWKMHHHLTVNYGIRWDYTRPVGEDNNRFSGFDIHTGKWYIAKSHADAPSTLPADVVKLDRNQITKSTYTNISPRLGLSWSVRPSTVINAGAGVTFDNWSGAMQAAQNARGGWPAGASQGVSDLNIAGVTSNATAQNPFGSLTNDMSKITTPFSTSTGGSFLDTEWKNPYSWQWNLLVQQQFGKWGLAKVSYVGSSTARVAIQIPQNRYATLGDSSTKPFSGMGQFNTIQSRGHANYNALQAQYQKSMQGLTFNSAFTWSKNIGVGCSDFWESCNIQNPYDLRSNRSVDSVDVPFVITASAVYQLPFGKGKAFANEGFTSKVVGGWKVNGMLQARSGTVFTPGINQDRAVVGTSSMQRPNVSGSTKGPRTINEWFNTSAYSLPTINTYGNAGRNSLRGPRYTNMDFSLFREFKFLKNYSAEFRAESFNVFNHPNLSNPDSTLEDSNFGKITGTTGSPRRLQFAGTFRF